MRKAIGAAFLEARLFFRSGKPLMPLAALLVFDAVTCQAIPLDAAGVFTMSAAAAFLGAVWLGFSCAWSENAALSALLALKVGVRRHLLAQAAPLCLAGAFAAVLTLGAPFLGGAVRADFFKEPMTGGERLAAVCVNVAAGVSGALFGGALHPRVVRDRKLAFALAALLCAAGLASGAAPWLDFVNWLLPPLYVCLAQAEEALAAERAALICARFLGYALAAFALRTAILARRRYD